MSILAMADRLISVYRRTPLVLDEVTAAASLNTTRQPAAASMIEVVVVGGTTGSGTVTVLGTVDGAPGSEVLTFTARGRRATIKRFSALATPAFTTTGLADEVAIPTIQALAVGADGSRVNSSVLIVAAWPVRKDAGPPRWPIAVPGSTQSEDTRVYLDYTSVWTPQEGDVFVDDRTLEEWTVIGRPAQHGGGMRMPHHYEITVRRNEGSRLAT